MTFQRCTRCVMPNTRPDTPFRDGVCAPCLTFEKRPEIDWAARKAQLADLLEAHRNPSGFDCIVPSSGGKDSHYQVLTLIEMGARPLVVTASTCQLTSIGRANIDNLARFATTIEVTPNRSVRAKLNWLGLKLVGDISWPEHVSIFTTPFRVAADTGISLIFYGENPQNQYGGPAGTEAALQLTRRWRSEFGGFLGLRPMDLVGMDGLTARDMTDYQMPPEEAVEAVGIQAHFLGQYLPWDSYDNVNKALAHGFRYTCPTLANWWPWENQDNVQTGLHDHLMYRKFGYGRGGAQASVDVRYGRASRAAALAFVQACDGLFPEHYMGVPLSDTLTLLQHSREELLEIMDRFTNWDLFDRADGYHRPMLKEQEA